MEIIKKYWYITLYLIILVLFLAVGLPHISIGEYEIENPSLKDLTNIQDYEFQFSPTLDFGSYTEHTYANFNISNSSPEAIEQEVNKIKDIFEFVGISHSNVYAIDSNTNQVSIVAEVPGNPIRLSALNNEFQRSGEIQILQIAPQTEDQTEISQFQEPQFIPSPFGTEDIRNVSISNQPINGGYGLVVEFNPEIRDQLLVGSFSEINQNQQDQLFLSVGGQPFAGQATALDLNSQDTRIFFRTNVGDDLIASKYLQYATLNGGFEVSLTPQDAIERDSSINEFRFYIMAGIFSLLAISIYLVYRQNKKLGLYLSIITIPSLIILLGVGKIFNLHLTLIGILGILTAYTVFFINQLINKNKQNNLLKILFLNITLISLINYVFSMTPFHIGSNVLTLYSATIFAIIINYILTKPFLNSVLEFDSNEK